MPVKHQLSTSSFSDDVPMGILLGYETALDYWRSCASVTDVQLHKALLGSSSERGNATKTLLNKQQRESGRKNILEYAALEQDSHLIFSGRQLHTRRRPMRFHTLTKIPAKSCMYANLHFKGAKIFVSTPEFCFLQFASKLPLELLIELGFELTGTYSLQDGDTKYKTIPLTSQNRLEYFVHRNEGYYGANKAKRALKYIAQGSASPKETHLTMLLCLPYNLGGYGFPKPELNKNIVLPTSLKNRFRTNYYSCDIYWQDTKVAIEYDSDQFHSGVNKTARDALRRSILMGLDIEVLSVTNKILRDALAFNEFAHALAQKSNRRLRYPKTNFFEKHLRLRGYLLSYQNKNTEYSLKSGTKSRLY